MQINIKSSHKDEMLYSNIEQAGFTFVREFSTKSATRRVRHYEVFKHNKSGKTYYIKSYSRKNGTVIMQPKDFSAIANIY